jgi:Ice-binding-like/Bacterial Ig-like domain
MVDPYISVRSLRFASSRAWNALSVGEEEKLMHKLMVSKIWISAFLLAAFVAGCGDADKNPGNPGSPLTPPTVLSVTPPNGSTLVCPNLAVISATFSKAMNPATINTTTFTLSGPSGSVTGTVTYDPSTSIATFTPPAASLTPSTTFTATITTGVADTFGNHLAANFTWSFTTSGPCLVPPPSGLGTACTFGILAATPVVSSVGPTSVSGDIGIFPAASITGFPPGTFTGTEHLGDAVAQTAQNDLTTAYNNALNAGGGPSVGAAITADIGGQTKPPGIYIATTTLGITGILTLDGSTNPNGVWIFKVGSALTTASGGVGTPASQVILIGGASPHNVFWVLGSSGTLGTNSVFVGTIMAKASITLTTGATLNGRALAETGQIALDSNPVTVPPCP